MAERAAIGERPGNPRSFPHTMAVACLSVIWASGSLAGQADSFRSIPGDVQLYDTAREKDPAFSKVFEFVNLLRYPSEREIERYRMRDQDDEVLYESIRRNICCTLRAWLRKDFVPDDVISRAAVLSGMPKHPDMVVARWETQGASFQFALSMGRALLVVPPPDSTSARTPGDLVSHVAKTYFSDHPRLYPPDKARIVPGAAEEGAGSWHGVLEYRITEWLARRVYWWTDGRVVAFFQGRIERVGGGYAVGSRPPQRSLDELETFWARTVEWRRRRHVGFSFEKALFRFGRPGRRGENSREPRAKASSPVEAKIEVGAATEKPVPPLRIGKPEAGTQDGGHAPSPEQPPGGTADDSDGTR